MVEWQTRIILPLNGACEGRVVWATEQGETQSQKTLVQPTAQVQVSGRPAPRLAPPSPAAIRQEMNTSCSPPGRCGAAINLVNIPTDTKNCLSCWSNGRFITRGQTFPPPRKPKTVHKGCLAKKIIGGTVCDKHRQVQSNHSGWGKHGSTLFFWFPRKDTDTRQGSPQGRAAQQSQSQCSSIGTACQPVCNLIPLSTSKYQNRLFLNRRLKTIMQIILILMHRQMIELEQ